MRDLYKRLALSPSVDQPTLDAALSRCAHSALRRDGEATLGDPCHRARYDELHRTLGDIGRLRAGLGLTHAPHWQGEAANDFSLPAETRMPRRAALSNQIAQAVAFFERWRGAPSAWLLVAVFTMGAGVGLALGLALLAWLGSGRF
ncbi:hypothetical protein ACGK9R_03865 [Halomonas sp. HNIBRBA4712]|uniref:hypothetical protein n=1 Tax=Halomonas sp. HNIBRBA4712 TaxID=3373087 RepID=UPI0037469459